MDTKDIRGFIRSYEAGSINKAAKELFISPQGLGKVIDRLESELDTRLFDRTPGGLVPTEAGIYFYSKSNELVRRIQDIELGIKSISARKSPLKIGYSCGVLNVLKMDQLDAFCESHPELNVIGAECSNNEVKQDVEKGRLDVAFVIGEMASRDIFQRKVFSIPYSAVIPHGHPLEKKSSVSMADLEGERLIILNEKYQSYYNIVQRCRDFHFVPDIRIKTMESFLIYRFAGEGMGIGIDVNVHDVESMQLPVTITEIVDSIPWDVYMVCPEEKKEEPIMKELFSRFGG